MAQRLRVFVSSPGDVPDERLRAALVIDKLAQDYSRFFVLESYRWEHEPMLASGHFQDAIEPPSAADIVLLILWSRLGTPLPEKTAVREYRGIDGRVPVTGTEWEYEEALLAARERGAPDILAFRNVSHPAIDPLDSQARARSLAQLEALDAFWKRHFADRGVFLAAYDHYQTLEEFAQRLEQALRKLIERRIAALARDQAQTEPIWTGAPFRGLEAYEFEHAPIFFGRDGLVARAAEQLAAQARTGTAFLLVCGPSGSGKSSLVKAALVPRLMKPQRITGAAFLRRVVFRPGDHPDDVILGLAEALTRGAPVEGVGLPELLGPGQDAHTLAAHLRTSVNAPGYVFAGALGRVTQEERQRGHVLAFEEAKLILVVDQLEELFTLPGISVEDRHLLIRLLAGLARSSAVWVVTTLRADFWHRAAEMPDMMELAQGHGRLDIAAPAPAELAEMIRKPALAAGLSFESHPETGLGLDAVLAERAAAEPGVLPLLSFTLDELYRRDVTTGPGRVLTYATYEALGGLEGAIATRADQTIADLPTAAQAALPRVLRTLATVSTGADHVAVARAAPLDSFPPGSDVRAVVEALTAARLLVASSTGTTPTVRFAHEALLSRWQRARDQLTADRRDLETRDLVERQRARWQQASGRAQRQLLLRDPDLANAVDLDRRWAGELATETRAFIQASRRRARRQQLFALGAAIVFGLVAAVAVYAQRQAIVQRARAESATRDAVAQRQQATERAQQAQQRLAALYTEQGRQELLHGSPSKAVVYLSGAYQNGATGPVLGMLLADAIRPIDVQLASLEGYTGQFSPDGTRVLTTSRDKTAKLWDGSTGRLLASLEGHTDEVESAQFSPDGTRVLTASRDKTVKLWDGSTGRLLASLEGYTGQFSPDGTRVLTTSRDETAKLWDGSTGRLLASLEGHTDRVESAQFSPDGTRVLTASRDKTVKLWDGSTGRLLASLEGHTRMVTSAQFSPDGTRVLTASEDSVYKKEDMTAKLWDGSTGHLLASLEGHTGRVWSAQFSPDGTRALTTAREDTTAKLWDGSTGRLLASLEGHIRAVTSAQFSPDGTRVLTASEDGTAKLWDGSTGRLLASLEGYTGQFSPDGTRVVTAGADTTAKLWDGRTGRLLASLEGHTDEVKSAQFSPDGTRVLTASADETAKLWDGATGRLLASLEGHTSGVWSAQFSPDGTRVLTTAGAGRLLASLEGHTRAVTSAQFSPDGARVLTTAGAYEDKTAKLWDGSTGRLLASLEGYTGQFSPEGTRVLTTSEDETAKLWDGSTGRLLASLEGHTDEVKSAQFSPDGTRVLTTSRDETAKLWEGATGRLLASLEGHTSGVWSAQFSPDGTRVLTASEDGTAKLWEGATGRLLASLEGHTRAVTSAQFSPDGTRVLTTSANADGTAKLWDGSTGRLLASLGGFPSAVTSAQFSPDGTRVLTASRDKTVKLWDGSTGRPLPSLEGHTDEVESAQFSPDGTRVLTASRDKTAKLWDGSTGRLLASLEGHTDGVESAQFSPDGTRVLTASRDKTAKLWDVHLETRSSDEIAALVCRRALWRLDEGRLIPTTPDATACPPRSPAP